jgi:hypothetical protein
VACLWQGLREKTALEIIDLIKRSSSQYNSSNNIYGYGTPNFWKAYLSAIAELQSTSTTSPQQ